MRAIKQLFTKKNIGTSSKAYLMPLHGAMWMDRNYSHFAGEAFVKNVIAHRSIAMVAQAAASIPFKLYKDTNKGKVAVRFHPILSLLKQPNPAQSGSEFLEMLYSYRQISGNAFILGAGPDNKVPGELYCLRPDRVTIQPGQSFLPKAYTYKVGSNSVEYRVDPVSGQSKILHIKTFHPLSDWYGLSSIEAAAYSIDQHNQSGEWNQSLLQNGARPSGAIVVRNDKGGYGRLNDQQYARLKATIDEIYSGPRNAGRPLLMEGGLEWQEMSITPKDMDFIQSKHSAARDIALAFGVPPQLLGIPGDNTYANLQEARFALWEQTVIPIAQNVVENFNGWFAGYFGKEFVLECDTDKISILAEKREVLWKRLEGCSFMTVNEKREQVGLGAIKNDSMFSEQEGVNKA